MVRWLRKYRKVGKLEEGMDWLLGKKLRDDHAIPSREVRRGAGRSATRAWPRRPFTLDIVGVIGATARCALGTQPAAPVGLVLPWTLTTR